MKNQEERFDNFHKDMVEVIEKYMWEDALDCDDTKFSMDVREQIDEIQKTCMDKYYQLRYFTDRWYADDKED